MEKALVLSAAAYGAIALSALADPTAAEMRRVVRLNSGYEMPYVGLGTWTLRGETCEQIVYGALKAGCRLLDTAKYYGNEAAVGAALRRAIADGVCTRGDVFVTTKLVPWSKTPEADIEDSLKNLGVDYIDLCLLHQHGGNDDKVYAAMVRAAKAGRIRSVGISNFYTEESIRHFIDDFGMAPAVIQNEHHLFYQNKALRARCVALGIVLESWYPFGGRGHAKAHLTAPTLVAIAKTHHRTPAQTTLRWMVQSGVIAIPGSANLDHVAENLAIWDFSLTAEEMAQLDALDTGRRYESW